MQPKHWAVVGGLLIALGLQLSGTAHGWADVHTPQFVAGLLVQIGTTVTAIFVEKPKNGA
jgi:hypothetical protein